MFTRVILSPAKGPEGELAWAWSDGDFSSLGGKYVRLVWNEDESKWTITAGQSTITHVSAAVIGEWDDMSLQFVDDGKTWAVRRYAVVDILALGSEIDALSSKLSTEISSRAMLSVDDKPVQEFRF